MKHQINIYTYYWDRRVKGSGKDKFIDTGIQFLKKINKEIEKEINAPLVNSNFEFKIKFQSIEGRIGEGDYTVESVSKYLKDNNFDVVTQWPLGFSADKDHDYFDDIIVFDRKNSLNNLSYGTHNHPNLFHMPQAKTLVETYKEDAPQLFKGKRLTKLMFFDKPSNVVDKDMLDSLEREAIEKNWAFKAVFEWQENDFENLRATLKELKEDQVILFEKGCWQDEKGNPPSGDDYINGRKNVIKVFIETECSADICSFRAGPSAMKYLFTRAKEIKNDRIYMFVGDNYIAKLPLQDRALSLDKNISLTSQTMVQYHIEEQLNSALLIGYLYKNDDYSYTSKEDFIQETRKRLMRIDGTHDSFLGFGQIIYFDENQMSPAPNNPLLEIRGNSRGTKIIFAPSQQMRDKEGSLSSVDVSYKNIDFLSIDHISIEDNTFQIVFDLELTTPHSEGIEILKFNNIVNDSLKHTLLKKEKLSNGYWYFRYNVSSTFSFIPKAENYPFDQQVVFLSYSLVSDRYGILEPIKNYNDDKIISDGWRVLGFRSGIIRRKDNHRPIFEKGYTLISEEHKVGIIIERPSSYTVTKVLVPLIFLAGLTVWATFLPLSDSQTIIALVTTAFLSAIALYFSTEKPKPLSLTTTDLIFLLFYSFVGITSLAIFILAFYPEYYIQGISYTRWGLLAFSISSIYFIYKRVQSFNGKIEI